MMYACRNYVAKAVNNAVATIEQGTRQNAAMVEQTSAANAANAANADMVEQVSQVRGFLSGFRLEDFARLPNRIRLGLFSCLSDIR